MPYIYSNLIINFNHVYYYKYLFKIMVPDNFKEINNFYLYIYF